MKDSIPERCDLAQGYQGSRQSVRGLVDVAALQSGWLRSWTRTALLRCILALLPPLERVPIKWNHLIDKDSLKIKELEHVGIEKVEQLFLDMR
jgi:hypothetical protein